MTSRLVFRSACLTVGILCLLPFVIFGQTATGVGQTVEVKASFLETPGFETTVEQYKTYDNFMSEIERTLTEMQLMVNRLDKAQQQLKALLQTVEAGPLKEEGKALLDELSAWDEEMVQRKLKAGGNVLGSQKIPAYNSKFWEAGIGAPQIAK